MTIQSRGIVTPRRNIELVTEVSGRVIWVDPGFLQGEEVTEGQLLLRIDQLDEEPGVGLRLIRQSEDAVTEKTAEKE